MTTSLFNYMDPPSYASTKNHPSGINKPWYKLSNGGLSYNLKFFEHVVHDIRVEGFENFTIDNAGFAVYKSLTKVEFTDDAVVRDKYYAEVEDLLQEKLHGVKKVVVFNHTIRRRNENSIHQPIQEVHVDFTPAAAEARVRRFVKDPAEAEELLKGRYQVINVWRPIEHKASDHPLAVVDWRSTKPEDFIKIDVLYAKSKPATTGTNGTNANKQNDDGRNKDALPESNANYEARGESYGVAPNANHKFYYVKDMDVDEVMFFKGFDSYSENREGSTVKIGGGRKGLADCAAHSAFEDPNKPADAPGRQSIEVRCLVFYEQVIKHPTDD